MPNFTPDGYHTATPYLIVNDGGKAIEFYNDVFGASEVMRIASPDGKIGHAEIQIGDSRLMMADEFPEMNALSPQTVGGTPVLICLYFENCDAVFEKAIAAGAKEVKPMMDQFYGDRSGTFVDPFGHQWTVATHIEDVSPEEVARRAAAMFGGA